MPNQRSPLRVWYVRNFAEFSAKLDAMRADAGVDWKKITTEHIEAGRLQEGAHKDTARNLWLEVRKARRVSKPNPNVIVTDYSDVFG